MYDLATLQAQLQVLKDAQVALTPKQQTIQPGNSTIPVTSTVPSLTRDEVKAIVLEVLREELSPKQQNPLLKAIGTALKQDEQVWLTSHIDKVEAELPMFIETDEGAYAVQAFVSFLRGKYGN